MREIALIAGGLIVGGLVGVTWMCLLQVNKDSIFGGLGQRAKRTAEFILSQGLAHIAASDAHSTYSRNPELARLREHISLNYSEDYARILLEENPRRIIENKPMLRA